MRRVWLVRSIMCAVLAATVLIVGGCGGSGAAHTGSGTTGGSAGTTSSAAPKSSSQEGSVDQAARAMLPAKVRAAGVLRFATELQWPPFDYKDAAGQPAGLEVDLVRAIGQRLGLKTEVSDVEFASIIPGVVNGRYDIGGNQLNDTALRRKVVQFIDYYRAEHSLLVSTKAPAGISATNLCGYSLAQNAGSPEVGLVQHLSQQCVAHGKKAITLTQLTGSAAAVLAVSNHRVDGYLMEPAVGRYLAAHGHAGVKMLPGVLPASAGPAAKATTGLVVAKTDDGLAKAVQAALQGMMNSGQYKQILAKWDVLPAALGKATINLGLGSQSG